MCHRFCGGAIQRIFNDCFKVYKKDAHLPADAELIIDAEPYGVELGFHRLSITILSRQQCFNPEDGHCNNIIAQFKTRLKEDRTLDNLVVFDDLQNLDFPDLEPSSIKTRSNRINWVNILVNLSSIGAILFLSMISAPSLLLTLELFSISFLTTAFTARAYLKDFFYQFSVKNLANMSTTVSLGWILSLTHTLYHSISMPICNSFSMLFMNFIMPILLITVINAMDEVRRLVLSGSKKMHLEGMRILVPKMAKTYNAYDLSEEDACCLSELVKALDGARECDMIDKLLPSLTTIFNTNSLINLPRRSLKKNMILKVERGECFPLDCRLVQGNTVVDASLITGEPHQVKSEFDLISAGALNLGQSVTVLTTETGYNSTLNKILFCSYQAKKNRDPVTNTQFTYFYLGLIAKGIVAASAIPYCLGTLTLPLLLQNVTGILFSICPCTWVIAHKLPGLLSIYHRSLKHIALRDDALIRDITPIHTVVFDKTGTLTTGMSEVHSSRGVSASLWDSIYLLEQGHGAGHPLAHAIMNYYEKNYLHQGSMQAISNVVIDPKNRGLSALVEGRRVDIGNASYFAALGINGLLIDEDKTLQGMTAVYVAKQNQCQGVIYIKHVIRKDISFSLSRLKHDGKKIIMLTGDSLESALNCNQQLGGLFDKANIHAAQTFEDKKEFLYTLMNDSSHDPKGVWFIGDGLNDAPSARKVSEKGGVSCAITSEDKAAFFTDISLNGSLDYLFKHEELNQFFKKIIFQNQCLLTYGALSFLMFIIIFSSVGITLSPLIPLMIMASTTGFILFNSYRVARSIDQALDKKTSKLKEWLASDSSIGLLLGASLCFNAGLLISTLASTGFVFPVLAGVAMGHVFLLGASVLISTFFVLIGLDFCFDNLGHRTAAFGVEAMNDERIHYQARPISRVTGMGLSLSHELSIDRDLCNNDEVEVERYGFSG